MTYVELIFRRYWKYKNKGYSDKKIIIKFIFYNFRLLFNKKLIVPTVITSFTLIMTENWSLLFAQMAVLAMF